MQNFGRNTPRECEVVFVLRHCEEQSDEAIQLSVIPQYGLLRFARNDVATYRIVRDHPTSSRAQLNFAGLETRHPADRARLRESGAGWRN